MFKKLFGVFICLLFSAPVLAGDISATYQYSDGQTMTITVRDASHVRMDTTPDSYMLLKGKKIYIVNKDEDGKLERNGPGSDEGHGRHDGGASGKEKGCHSIRYETEGYR